MNQYGSAEFKILEEGIESWINEHPSEQFEWNFQNSERIAGDITFAELKALGDKYGLWVDTAPHDDAIRFCGVPTRTECMPSV